MMKKIEPFTAAVIISGIAALTVVLMAGPPAVRDQLLVAIGSLTTVLAGVLPKLVGSSSDPK